MPRIGWLPRVSALVVQVALPFATDTPEQPEMTLVPSWNTILPVGVPPLPITAAVKVTLWRALIVYADESIVADTDMPPDVEVDPVLPVPVVVLPAVSVVALAARP